MKLAFTVCDAAGAANVGAGCEWMTYEAEIPDSLLPVEVVNLIQDRQEKNSSVRFSYKYLTISPVLERKTDE